MLKYSVLRELKSEADLKYFLTEYAKLLPLSNTKLMLVTSDVFFKEFFLILDWNIYKKSDDFLCNNLLGLKKHYCYSIMSLNVDYGYVFLQNINNIASNIFNVIVNHFNYDLINNDMLLKNIETLRQFILIQNTSGSYYNYNYISQHPLFSFIFANSYTPNAITLYNFEGYLFTPGYLNNLSGVSFASKNEVLFLKTLELIHLTCNKDEITIYFSIFFKKTFKW